MLFDQWNLKTIGDVYCHLTAAINNDTDIFMTFLHFIMYKCSNFMVSTTVLIYCPPDIKIAWYVTNTKSGKMKNTVMETGVTVAQ